MKIHWKHLLASSLQVRVTLLILGIFLAGMWSLSLYVSHMLREDMVRQQGEQQRSTAAYIAAEIDHELQARFNFLSRLAASLGPDQLDNIEDLQRLLEQQQSYLNLFNGGSFVTGRDGISTASTPLSAKRHGISYLDRDYVLGALRDGRPTIGKPVIGKTLRAPIFGMAVPIRNARGVGIGALVGVTNLSQPNFLDQITKVAYGKHGYLLLEDSSSRLIITGSDKRRIMQPLPPPGRNWLIDRHVQGFDETGITVNPLGVEVLATSKRIPSASWFVVVALPTAEAFAPIQAMQQRIQLATLLLTMLVGGFSWWVLKRQLKPIRETVETITAMTGQGQPLQSLPIARHDEIGKLIGSFNALLRVLSQRELALKESEQKLFTILESVDAHIYLKDIRGRYIFANRHVRELFGKSMQEIVGQGDEMFFDAETVAQLRCNDRLVLENGQTLRAEETNLNVRDGRTSTYLSVKLPLRNQHGEIYALCGISTDISDRKQLEIELTHKAHIDYLTGVSNRRHFMEQAELELSRALRYESPLSLFMMDIDLFKQINDRYGHKTGDSVLMKLTEVCRQALREIDFMGRVGGEEFAILLPETNRQQAAEVAERLRAEIEGAKIPLENGLPIHFTVSIGIASLTSREDNLDVLLHSADMVLYEAKRAGRNQVCAAPQ